MMILKSLRLKKQLEFQTKENESLNDEFKNAMKDFVRSKIKLKCLKWKMKGSKMKQLLI